MKAGAESQGLTSNQSSSSLIGSTISLKAASRIELNFSPELNTVWIINSRRHRREVFRWHICMHNLISHMATLCHEIFKMWEKAIMSKRYLAFHDDDCGNLICDAWIMSPWAILDALMWVLEEFSGNFQAWNIEGEKELQLVGDSSKSNHQGCWKCFTLSNYILDCLLSIFFVWEASFLPLSHSNSN
jgi:hypothetical protein